MISSKQAGISKFGLPTLFLTCLLLIYYYVSKNSPSVSVISMSTTPSLSNNNTSIYRDELEEALKGASNVNKTVIIAVVNEAYIEGDKSMFDIFLDGFWLGEDTRGLTNHLLIVAVDQIAYERCMFLKLHCYRVKTNEDDFVGEKAFMSEGFLKMMWLRTAFLRDVLRRGYNFIFTDTDVVWLRNPFPHLMLNETLDLQASAQWFNGNQYSLDNEINTGFYMIRSNNKTIALFDEWYERRHNSSGKKEQDILNDLKFEGAFKRLGIEFKVLDSKYVSTFCDDSKDIKVVSVFHAACCGTIKNKAADLIKVLHDWKRIKDLIIINKTMEFQWSKHSACLP
ncbi:uncharacterized protein At1g28695-like [Rutidosis leptorrhynchoides]|uniref:uncharacterized protein At1g28695-like n=1 Tax=Rutidosis leptorrhynchoides TaxID=125765 RepID=UPI003A9A3306